MKEKIKLGIPIEDEVTGETNVILRTNEIRIVEEAFEEIERLKEDNEYLNKVNIELSTEKNRLNNIINKGKIYCEDVIQEHENGEYNVSTTQLAIEEHKKNIISLLNILNGDLENYWRSDKE